MPSVWEMMEHLVKWMGIWIEHLLCGLGAWEVSDSVVKVTQPLEHVDKPLIGHLNQLLVAQTDKSRMVAVDPDYWGALGVESCLL